MIELTEIEKTGDAQDAFVKFIASIENPRLRNRVEDSAYVNAFGHSDDWPTGKPHWGRPK
jgi:hypothetical protein